MELNEAFQMFLQDVLRFIPHLIAALVTFIASLILAGMAARWAERTAMRRTRDPELTRLLSRIARWSVLVLGTIVALDQVDFNVTSFVAGLGIAGFTIGFALQDIARNFVSGIILLIRQPFNIGAIVKIADYTGTVLEITTRDTVIRTLDGEMVIVPNIDVFTNAIVNYSRLPTLRRSVQIGLGYDEDVNRATGILLDAIRGVDGVLDDPPPTIFADELGDSALTLKARFWLNQETHNRFKVHSDVVRAIKEVAEVEGIDMPFPTQTVRLEGSLPAAAPAVEV